MPRRKPGTLLPLEVAILETGLARRRREAEEFHGFELARELAESGGSARRLTSHGTLYKALGRLEDGGLLESEWEAPDVAVAAGRPRRRLYRVTGAGERAVAAHHQARPAGARPTALGPEPGT